MTIEEKVLSKRMVPRMTIDDAIEELEAAEEIFERDLTMDFQFALDFAVDSMKRRKKYMWHDIIEEPDDMPVAGTQVLVACECADGIVYDCQAWLGDEWREVMDDGFIRFAWKYIEPVLEVVDEY